MKRARLSALAREKAPNEQHDDRADHSADEARPLARPVPAQGLAKISREESSDDAQYGSQDES